MKIQDYTYLFVKSRKEVIRGLGEEFNDDHGSEWTYVIRQGWCRKWLLIIMFVDDKVDRLILKRTFAWEKISSGEVICDCLLNYWRNCI